MRSRSPGILALCVALLPALAPGEETPVNPAIAPHLSDLRDMLGEAQKAVNQYYMPASKVDKAFAQRCRETESALRGAQSVSEGYALIRQGFDVTQATVSRDITELGLHKAPRADGHVYA